MEIQERINQLMEDEAFAKEFSTVENANDVVALFAKNGIEVPEEVAAELFDPKTLVSDEDELSETTLENVAGGLWGGALFGGFVGGALGDGLGYAAGYLGGRLAGWDKKKSKAYAKKAAKFGKHIGTALGGAIGAATPV